MVVKKFSDPSNKQGIILLYKMKNYVWDKNHIFWCKNKKSSTQPKKKLHQKKFFFDEEKVFLKENLQKKFDDFFYEEKNFLLEIIPKLIWVMLWKVQLFV